METSFNKGFLMGVFLTLGVVLGSVLIYFFFFHDALQNSTPAPNYSYEINGYGMSDEEKEKYGTFLKTQNTILATIKDKFYEKVDNEEIYHGAYDGMLAALNDPYSCYYSKDEYAAITQTTDGEYVGIGCYVGQHKETKEIMILSVIEGGPAEKAGLLAEDIMVAVDGRDITGMDIDYAITFVKGKAGTKVVITVKRGEETLDFAMVREKIEPKTVTYEMLSGKVGYIYMGSFYKHSAEQFKAALAELESEGMEKLIVDLRDDPGGLYDIAVDMVDIFIGENQLVAYVEDNDGKQEKSYTKDPDTFDKPVVILINGNSASASELFTQAMRDYGKATVIGTTSFGKGVYQNLYPVSNSGDFVKLTGGRYFSPKGICIHGVGIEPDITVEYEVLEDIETDSKREQDSQIRAALEFLKE